MKPRNTDGLFVFLQCTQWVTGEERKREKQRSDGDREAPPCLRVGVGLTYLTLQDFSSEIVEPQNTFLSRTTACHCCSSTLELNTIKQVALFTPAYFSLKLCLSLQSCQTVPPVPLSTPLWNLLQLHCRPASPKSASHPPTQKTQQYSVH